MLIGNGLRCIHTIDKQTTTAIRYNQEEFMKAHQLIREAEQVIFLGFGYDRTNLERLDIDFSNSGVRFLGTGLNFTQLERDTLEGQCDNGLEIHP